MQVRPDDPLPAGAGRSVQLPEGWHGVAAHASMSVDAQSIHAATADGWLKGSGQHSCLAQANQGREQASAQQHIRAVKSRPAHTLVAPLQLPETVVFQVPKSAMQFTEGVPVNPAEQVAAQVAPIGWPAQLGKVPFATVAVGFWGQEVGAASR